MEEHQHQEEQAPQTQGWSGEDTRSFWKRIQWRKLLSEAAQLLAYVIVSAVGTMAGLWLYNRKSLPAGTYPAKKGGGRKSSPVQAHFGGGS